MPASRGDSVKKLLGSKLEAFRWELGRLVYKRGVLVHELNATAFHVDVYRAMAVTATPIKIIQKRNPRPVMPVDVSCPC